MALRANKPAVNAPQVNTEVAEQEEVQQAAPVQEPTAPVNTPAVRQSAAPAVAGSMQDLNAGILEGIDDMGGGNYVSLDANQFLYKASNTSVDNVDMVVKFGKRFYQWVDESGENKVYNNSDTKLDDRYKLKFELRWDEQEDEESEGTEYTMSLSTTSALNFISYVKSLAAAGKSVAQVITRMTTSRQKSRDGKNTYFRVEFEAFDIETGNPLNIKTNPNK